LIEEMGDVLAALAFFDEENLSQNESKAVSERLQKKLALFNQWHREQREGTERMMRSEALKIARRELLDDCMPIDVISYLEDLGFSSLEAEEIVDEAEAELAREEE
jgi:hypothetical protein